MKISYNHFLFQKAAFIAILLFIWYLMSISSIGTGNNNNMWFANIFEVSSAIKNIFLTDFIQISTTFLLILKAIVVVIVLGVLLGIVVGLSDLMYRTIKVPLDFWRSIPPIIIIGILLNLDGVEEKYWRIWLVIFGTLPIMIVQIADAIQNSSKKRMLIFQSINTNLYFRGRYIIIYEILPSLFSTTRTIISLAIIIVIVSEMVVSPAYGIGGEITSYQSASQIQFVYAYAFIVGIIGLLLNEFIRYLEKKFVYWV